jgi:hypothetical protein
LARRPQERSKNMCAETAGALLLLSGCVALWAGCSREPTPPACPPSVVLTSQKRIATGGACARDIDCRSGFCDRDVCKDAFERSVVGEECVQEPPAANGEVKWPHRDCNRLLCLDGRCRSCISDAECQSYFGGGKCTPMNTSHPKLTYCAYEQGPIQEFVPYPAGGPPPPPFPDPPLR